MRVFIVCLCVVLQLMACTVFGEKESHEHAHVHPDDVDGKHDASFDREAILGSKEAEKEFAELPPDEAKSRLRILAGKMDENGDGKVSRPELEKWIYNSFIKMDVDDAVKRMGEYDTDKNGYISWKEIRQNSYGYSDEDVAELQKSEGDQKHEIVEMLEADEKKFNLADKNGDGKLDELEFSMFEHPYNYESMHEIEVERLMRDHDKDNDGKLTYFEFTGSREPGGDKESEIADKEQFDLYDKDRDGILDRVEVKAWAIPDNEEQARDEANHLIEHADKDKDGELTMDEIVDNHDLFVGSQVTDYGDYLNRPIDEL